jgi:hypothetical protein
MNRNRIIIIKYILSLFYEICLIYDFLFIAKLFDIMTKVS